MSWQPQTLPTPPLELLSPWPVCPMIPAPTSAIYILFCVEAGSTQIVPLILIKLQIVSSYAQILRVSTKLGTWLSLRNTWLQNAPSSCRFEVWMTCYRPTG